MNSLFGISLEYMHCKIANMYFLLWLAIFNPEKVHIVFLITIIG